MEIPEARLQRVKQGDSSEATESDASGASGEPATEVDVPETFPEMAERFEQNGFTVAYDPGEQVLRVEKHGIEHAIEHDGTIRGDRGVKYRMSMIVDRFM